MKKPTPLTITMASKADADEIVSLVNKAYRPDPECTGWTHENNLVAGARITNEQVIALFSDHSCVLVMRQAQSKIIACVHVQCDQTGASIGMLATDPKLQSQGHGKQMLSYAESYAIEHFNPSVIKMSVLSSRPELLAFYERRGYALTGEIEKYPLSAEVGVPIVSDLKVLFLRKKLH